MSLIEVRNERRDALKGDFVDAYKGSKVDAREGSGVNAREGSFVNAYKGSDVKALKGSTVNAYADSKVYAHEGSTVFAYEGSVVTAFAGSRVYAYEGSTVDEGEGSTVIYHSAVSSTEPKPVDLVNSPPHYTHGGIETITVIDAWGLGFCLGNVVKYIARAEHKGTPVQDLEKALWYLKHEIERRKARE